MACPLTVPPSEAGDPAVVPLMLAVYVPSPESTTPAIVPRLVPPPNPNTTVAPPVVSGFPNASFAWNVATALCPAISVSFAIVRVEVVPEAWPGVPVARKTIVTPGNMGVEAETRLLFAPAAVPTCQDVTAATPLAPVDGEAPVSFPAPLSTTKVTGAPETAFPNVSLAATAGGTGTVVLTVVVSA